MTDVHNIETRSFNMSMIKGKDTIPEIIVRKFLHRNGFRYRLNYSRLPGKPDIVIPKFKTVIFVNGCFWHGHEGCKYFVIPKTRTKWWMEKINATIERDKTKKSELEAIGWKVFTIWECDLKSGNLEDTINNLILKLKD
jgi:DNA mismatch endonuclease (patch repair protein)